MGVPLHRIKDVRTLYNEDAWGDNEIDFEDPVEPPSPKGHVIAARISSENPDEVRREREREVVREVVREVGREGGREGV